MDREAIENAANKVAEEYDARVFVYSGAIDRTGFAKLIQSMQTSKEQPLRNNSVLLLTTLGGSPDDAYKIARLFQSTSDRFSLCIPSVCKSAGTLIALGASDLVMTAVSELGPLDVQLRQRDEIGQRRSGLVVRAALEGLSHETFSIFERTMLGIKSGSHSISFDAASKIAATISTGVMAPVYAQINPEALGSDLRDLHVATAYGERLVSHGGNAKPETIHQLVEGYPSHGFIIDQAETEGLFTRVEDPSECLSELISALGHIVYVEQDHHTVARLDRAREAENGGNDAPEDADDGQGSRVDAAREGARPGDRKGQRKAPQSGKRAKSAGARKRSSK